MWRGMAATLVLYLPNLNWNISLSSVFENMMLYPYIRLLSIHVSYHTSHLSIYSRHQPVGQRLIIGGWVMTDPTIILCILWVSCWQAMKYKKIQSNEEWWLIIRPQCPAPQIPTLLTSWPLLVISISPSLHASVNRADTVQMEYQNFELLFNDAIFTPKVWPELV